MRGIELKNGCIFYYGNPSGYVEEDTAIVEVIFQNEEFSKWLVQHNLIAIWREGVFEKLLQYGTEFLDHETQIQVKNCRIWQLRADINPECKFIGYEELKENFGEPDKNNYQLVYEGEIETNDLESIYTKFNLNHPHGFTGHSLSMSDVVELYDDDGSEFYYVDRFGFKEIDFEKQKQRLSMKMDI